MRELFPIEEESTTDSLVLRTDDGERFFIPRASLSSLVDDSPAGAESNVRVVESTEPTAAPTKKVEESTPAVERALPEPDPLYAKPLSMRPSEIQARIRAGASAEEIADEMGVAISRIDPYSHPVLLEREQVAEAAKRSHPIREDGPAKLTLFEILATAFAARGHSISDASWDAVRQPGDDWVVRLSWKAGLSDNVAEWSFKRGMGFNATTEARNPIAADLTDPDFVQPVRSLTAVSHPSEEELEEDSFEDAEITPDKEDNGPDTREEFFSEGDFLQHPEPEQAPSKRKRKAVTPHWEDVLLGVRTNTKRPRK
ncbi:septation protein SepH [Corynebacterium breve]|uniref:Septation protein SepH n=1 Tax=Corynebacterium breve TaxID=3049799 RepID=A0ABY8VJF1_9CORY|nr:septation protein SepH [Corynebacterium breve]WIM68358.1 septation protein SepH [Corynebacterium breve]